MASNRTRATGYEGVYTAKLDADIAALEQEIPKAQGAIALMRRELKRRQRQAKARAVPAPEEQGNENAHR